MKFVEVRMTATVVFMVREDVVSSHFSGPPAPLLRGFCDAVEAWSGNAAADPRISIASSPTAECEVTR